MAILAPLPARDPESRARLLVAADRAVPTVLARDRLLAVAGPVGVALPAGGVRRGATIALDGPPGSGSTTVAFTLAAAATSAGEWAAVVDPDGTMGAARGCRCRCRTRTVRGRSPRTSRSVGHGRRSAARRHGAGVRNRPPVVASRRCTSSDGAGARTRGSARGDGTWPTEATLRLRTEPSAWAGLEQGSGLLDVRLLDLHVEGTGVRRADARVRMTRTACVWCPDWPVIAARRRDDALRATPVVVRERIGSRDVVRACCATARAAGVTRGMRRREAEARCPEAVCIDVDEPNEARAFESVARAIEVFTPRVVLERPGRCEFPTRGPSRYFGGDEPLAAHVRDAVADVLGPDGDDVRLGIADGAFTARCAARRSVIVPKGESAAFLAPWPVTTFDDDAIRRSVGALGDPHARRSRRATTRRRARAFRHRRADGFTSSRVASITGRPVLVAPPPDLIEQIELDPPAERVDMAAFAAKGLADRLLARLDERGLACTRVLIEAETEHGERLTRCWRSRRQR